MKSSYQNRIAKKRAASQLVGRKSFQLEVHNHFFYEVKPEKGPLWETQENVGGLIASPLERSELKNQHEQQTLSFAHGRKDEVRVLKQAYSLPEIKRKLTQRPQPLKKQILNQIVKSQLGCFNYFQIMEKREQAQRNKRDYFTRNSSFVSEDDFPNQVEPVSQEQAPYEEYDKQLMEIKFNFEKPRRLRFNHKANWSISK